MRYRFYGEPGLQIMDNQTGNPLFKFDNNGELVLSDDNPFLKRMSAHYRNEPIDEQAQEKEPLKGVRKKDGN